MPYTYGTKNGPSLGKSAPGLPVPARYDNTINTVINTVASAVKTFINSTFIGSEFANWANVTNGSTPGSASGTVSNTITVPNTTGMRFGSDSNGLSGALKISDNFFVMLTSEVADQRRTNLTLFDVSTGCSPITTIGVSSGSTQGQAAQIVPSSNPLQFLVTWRNYETSYQEIELYRADPNSGLLSVARQGTKNYTASLSVPVSEFGLPWTVNPLGLINGKEMWIATHPTTNPCFITYDGSIGSLTVTNSTAPYTVGYFHKVQENNNDAFLVGFCHPYGAATYGSTPAHSFSPAASIKLNKLTLSWTRLQDGFTYKYGSVGVYNSTPDYYHGGIRSYGYNGCGFFLSYRGSYATTDGKPGYCHVDTPPSGAALSYIDVSGAQKISIVQPPLASAGAVSAYSLTPIGPTAIAARGNSTDFFNTTHHEKTNAAGFTYINILYLHEEGYLAQKNVSLPFIAVESHSTQLVPFGDRFLVISKGNNTNNAQAAWVYPR